MYTRFRLLALIAFAALLLVSCSVDAPNEPVPPSGKPDLTINILTTTHEVGHPIAFRASVTGATLHDPVYTWNFGDGSPEVVTSTDTVSHTYTVEGSYQASANITNPSWSAPVQDTISVDVAEAQPPVWHQWNAVTCTVHGAFKCDFGGSPPSSDIITHTLVQSAGPYLNLLWNGMHMVYDTAYYSMVDQHYSLHINLTNGGNRLDSVYVYSAVIAQNSGGSATLVLRGLDLVGPLTADSAVYRLDGIAAANAVQKCIKTQHPYMTPSQVYTFDHPTSDMYVEVRFYKK